MTEEQLNSPSSPAPTNVIVGPLNDNVNQDHPSPTSVDEIEREPDVTVTKVGLKVIIM